MNPKSISRDWLDNPFFEARHRTLGEAINRFVESGAIDAIDHGDLDNACRKLVGELGAAKLLDCAVATPDGDLTTIDSRSICLSRESLAYADGLADFAFAMQGLGSGAIALAGAPSLRRLVLPKVRSGEWLAAFALSEKEAGSDVAAMTCAARTDGDSYVIDGEKTWISNGGIADVYTVFARTEEAPGSRGISAFVLFPDDPGFSVVDRIDIVAPHPLATIRFDNCRIPAERRLGAPGTGFRIAMQTLDVFRASVAAASLGFARRALDEAIAHARDRRMFGGTLADLQLTQASLGDMATETEGAAMLTYSAAWRRDIRKLPTTREAAMAKLAATETAQRVVDRAVQMFGGRGVRKGEIVESLYREVRALRIYEGATEVQKLIVARDLLKSR
ncbi:acyl-CoA dehydrogenase family protein [Bradyrhizobium sp. Pear77]|uniref:acyl-CoA dehydrogenase family protein n=1 Tax=Bradyrhizobium altum TaxID=1571202 RepID=UPI001E572F05|nr:acyl-CoA dehydrogenase family protein [Bradyrhizobium altum]MCC8952766.1 acyl-CoA dehydrogenase family protein [Bradyrhizobium altum]